MYGITLSKITLAFVFLIITTLAFPRTANADSVSLYRIAKSGNQITVSYRKDFDTCVHMVDANSQIIHIQNFFCEKGVPTNSVRTSADFTRTMNVGDAYKLCHGNNYGVCSVLTAITADVMPIAIAPPPAPAEPNPIIPLSREFVELYGTLRSESDAMLRNQLLVGLFGIQPIRNLATAPIQSQFDGLSQYLYLATSINNSISPTPAPVVANASCNELNSFGEGELGIETCDYLHYRWLQSLPARAANRCYHACVASIETVSLY